MQNCLFIANLASLDLHLYVDKREQMNEGYFPTSPSTFFWLYLLISYYRHSLKTHK